MGIEYQNVKFSTLQPAWSHGQFDYNGSFTDIPNISNTTGGVGQFILQTEAAPATINGNPNPNGFSWSGGSDQVYSSNINKTYDQKVYFATYFQDDCKVNPKLTLNLGVRWDYFGPINETNGGQANFVPAPVTGTAIGAPTFIVPATGKDNRALSTTSDCLTVLEPVVRVSWICSPRMASPSADQPMGPGLGADPENQHRPTLGFAYEINPKWVVRGGVGLFYNSFENQGYGPNIGENYPFVFNFDYQQQQLVGGIPSVTPISANSPWAGCATAGPGYTATLSSGLSCIGFSPLDVNAQGLGLQGLQFKYKTPRTLSANLACSIPNQLAFTAGGLCVDRRDRTSRRASATIRSTSFCRPAPAPRNTCHFQTSPTAEVISRPSEKHL